MDTPTLLTLIILLYISGPASCAGENTTVPARPENATPKTNSSSHPETRIVNGDVADLYDFPHQAYVSTEVQTNGQLTGFSVCGGSIVTSNYILTAAHCVDKTKLDQTKVMAGTNNLNNPRYSVQISSAAKIFVHKCYDRESLKFGDLRNDIAIVKLRRAFRFGEFLQPIRVDVRDRAGVGRTVTVIGWGRTKDSDEDSLSEILLKAQLNIISENLCNETFRSPFMNYDSTVCASANVGSACQGDSGGPLICIENRESYVCGITSFVPAIGCSLGPSGYTRVSHYKNWIYDVVKNGRDSSLDCVGEISGSCMWSGFSCGVIIIVLAQYLR